MERSANLPRIRASLALEQTKAMIQRAMLLIAGVEGTRFQPLGGKGL